MNKLKRLLTIGLAVLLMLCMSISLVGCKKENAYQDIKYNGFTYTWHKKSNTYYLTGDLVQDNPEIMNIPPYINGNEVSYFGFLEFPEGGMNFADQFNRFYSPSLRNVIELSIPYCMNIEEEYGLVTGHSTYENNCPEKIIVVNNTAKKKDSDAIVYFSTKNMGAYSDTAYIREFYCSSISYNQRINYFLGQSKNEYPNGECYFEIASGGRFKICKANTAYMFNYENCPNDGYFFINDFEYGAIIENTPYEPIRDGYTFGGWYKESECINAWNFETDTLPQAQYNEQEQEIYQETKLYAKWVKE